jgi:hypothetical protein
MTRGEGAPDTGTDSCGTVAIAHVRPGMARWHIQLEEDVDLPQCHMMKDRMLVAEIVLVVVVAMADLVAQANQFESDLGQCKGENLSHPYHLAELTVAQANQFESDLGQCKGKNLSHPYHLAELTPLVHPNNTNFQVLTR